MERLTQRLRTGEVLMAVEYEEKYTEQEWISVLQVRLAAYEDTGLTPEEINDLASVREISPEAEYAISKHAENIIERLDKLLHQTDDDARLRKLSEADKDGRLVVLPCKVGDTVYFRTYDCNGTVDLGIQPHKVTAIVGHAIVRGRYTDVGLLPAQYGVSWFLTHEEAEKALKATKDV